MYTRLDIINAMVGATGARPFTADQNRHPLYMKAEQKLEQVQADVQTLGLWFNTETRCIEPQTSGEIIVPQGCIKADPVDRNINLTLRGSRMYDLSTGSYEIGQSVRMKMHFEVDFEELPVSIRKYMRAKAVFEFMLDEDATDPKLSNYRAERDREWGFVYRENLRNQQQNIYDNPHNTVARLRRGHSSGPRILRSY